MTRKLKWELDHLLEANDDRLFADFEQLRAEFGLTATEMRDQLEHKITHDQMRDYHHYQEDRQ